MSTLVTAFKPFQRRGVNGSSTILQWLRRRWPVAQFHSRILPVAWEQAPVILDQLVRRHQPHRYLGIGEGHPGRCAWESIARNQRHGTDETGLFYDSVPITPNAPSQRQSTWDAPAPPLTGLLPANIPLSISTDAGSFLCNCVLWTALEPGLTVTQAAFLHLPPQGSIPNRAYVASLGPFVLSLLLAKPSL